MRVDFYHFSKKQHSTKIPTSASLERSFTDINLKGDCSVLAPTIVLRRNIGGTQIEPFDWNYAEIPDFGRYYFIKDWRFVGDQWEADMVVDVLASWRSALYNSEQYVMRSYNATNGAIIDELYPATSQTVLYRDTFANPFEEYNNGCFIVGILSASSQNSFGAVTYYAMDRSDLQALKAYMFSNVTQTGGIEISEALFKSITNPMQYIVSCQWVPIPYADISGTTTSDVYFGWYLAHNQSGITAKIVYPNNSIVHFRLYKELQHHPQIDRGSYMDKAPFTRRTLFFQPFGMIPIDVSYLEKYLEINVYVDLISGQGILKLSTFSDGEGATNYDFYATTAQVGVPAALASNRTDIIGGITAGLSTAASIVSGSAVGAVSGVGSAIGSLMGTPEKLGASGSMAAYNQQYVYVTSEFMIAVQDHPEHLGRPLCDVRVLSTMAAGVISGSTGYVKIHDPDIDFPCYDAEKSELVNLLESGCFLE